MAAWQNKKKRNRALAELSALGRPRPRHCELPHDDRFGDWRFYSKIDNAKFGIYLESARGFGSNALTDLFYNMTLGKKA